MEVIDELKSADLSWTVRVTALRKYYYWYSTVLTIGINSNMLFKKLQNMEEKLRNEHIRWLRSYLEWAWSVENELL